MARDLLDPPHMANKASKLKLSRETLRKLDATRLSAVAGATVYTGDPSLTIDSTILNTVTRQSNNIGCGPGSNVGCRFDF